MDTGPIASATVATAKPIQ